MNSEESPEPWDLVIEPQSSILSLDLADLWNYRDLLLMLVKRDFVSFYKQTILGPFWFFLQPLFTTLVYVMVFGNLAGLSTDGLPKYLFYLSGITAWNYFADCITKTSTVFSTNAAIFGKVYFPRLIMPLSIVISNLVKFFVQMLLLVLFVAYFVVTGGHLPLSSTVGILPLLILMMALLGLGTGLIISSLTTKYRDLSFLVSFGVQLLMYASTVIYPLSGAPERYRRIIELNPMTSIIEAFRHALFGRGEFTAWSLIYSGVVTLVFLVIGIAMFNTTEKTFIDTV